MPMRIKQADLAAFVQQTLQNVRAGFAAAYGQGIDMIPETEITFDCDVIQSLQALSSVTTTSDSSTASKTEATPDVVETKADSVHRYNTTIVATNGTDETITTRKHAFYIGDGSADSSHES